MPAAAALTGFYHPVAATGQAAGRIFVLPSQKVYRSHTKKRLPAAGTGQAAPILRRGFFTGALQAGRFCPPLGVCGVAGFPGRCKHCRPQAAFRSATGTKCRLLARRSSPAKHRAGFCRGLQDISDAKRQCTPSSPSVTPPLAGEALSSACHPGSPVRGAVGVSRLRGAASCSANILPGWRKAPFVCALRRIHRPVCGARIARRALKHACALRPLRCREAAKTGAVSD